MKKLPSAIHVELIASLFATMTPPMVMSALFVLVGGIAVADGDVCLRVLFAAGTIATIARLVLALRYRGALRDVAGPAPSLDRIERRFGAAYAGFAMLLGLFAARAFAVASEASRMLVAVLIVGYAAGVSTGVALRPRIAVSSMVAAVLPLIAVAALGTRVEHWTLAVVLAGLLAGGIRSTLVRYRAALAEIAMRQRFAALARSDPLTALPNRLALAEHLDASVRTVPEGSAVAVFCVDLDDFKPVNDSYGHPVGDAVLRAAAVRLTALLAPGDLCARIGGDEFVIVRVAGGGTAAMEGFALRTAMAMSEPYAIDGLIVSVGASIGWSPVDPATDPEDAIADADRALYRTKRNRARPVEDGTATGTVARLPIRPNGVVPRDIAAIGPR